MAHRLLLGRVLLAAVAGWLTSLAYPTVNLWWLAPFSLAGLILATRGVGLRRGALIGFVFGAALHLPLLSWSGIFLGWVPRGALTLLMAAYAAVAGAGLGVVSRLPLRLATPLLACWWVAHEAVASRFPFGGFGWTRLAFSQTDAPTLGLAALGGAPLVSFSVALTASCLAAAVVLLWRGGGGWVPVVALHLAAGLLLMAGSVVPRPTAAQAGTLNILGVQGNAEPRIDFNDTRREVLDNHARVARAAASQIRAGSRSRPDLMVWPENASDIDPLRNSDAADVINTAVDAVGAPTLVGGLRVVSDREIENTSWLWRPGQGVGTEERDSYVKQLPVPFVEFVPWRGFFQRLVPMLEMAGSMRAGTRLGIFDVANTRVGDLICFEIVSDSLVRRTVDAGASVVVLQTNNATFGYTAESEQQLAITRLRAVEHGRSFLQISTVGVSAFVGPDGTVSQPTELYTATAIQQGVPLRTTRTLADRLGAAPELGLVAGGMLGFIPGLRRRDAHRVQRSRARVKEVAEQ